MKYYRIESQTNQEPVVKRPEVYESFSDAQSALKNMMVEQGKQMNVAKYISAIRKGKHRAYRAEIANVLKSIFSEKEPFCFEKIKQLKNTLEDFQYACQDGEKEPTDNFDARQESGAVLLFDFDFDQHLHLEFYIETDATSSWLFHDYFFMQDKNGSYKVNIEEAFPPAPPKQRKSNSQNLVSVYRYLSDVSLSSALPYREVTDTEIQNKTGLGKETVRAHMQRLIDLGLPISKYTPSKEERKDYDAGEIYQVNLSRINSIPRPVNASALGDSVNPLLILFVLKSSNIPMRQKDISEIIQKEYHVSIKRAAVARNIEILKSFNYSIDKTEKGYVLKKKT